MLDVTTKAKYLYESLLFGEVIPGCEAKRQVFANGYLAIPMVMNLNANVYNFENTYNSKVDSKNLYKYFREFHIQNLNLKQYFLKLDENPLDMKATQATVGGIKAIEEFLRNKDKLKRLLKKE